MKRNKLKSAGIVIGMLLLFSSGFLSLAGGIYLFFNAYGPKGYSFEEYHRIGAAKSQLATIGAALDAFEVDCGRYPATEDGFEPLLRRWARDTNWRGPYLAKAIELDPWGHSIRYAAPGVHNDKGYDLASAGPDGQFDTEDDLSNWDAGR